MGRERRPTSLGRVSIPAKARLGGGLLLVLLAVAGTWLALSRQGWALVTPGQGMVGEVQAGSLAPGRTVGQTFVAHHAGLVGVDFWLEPANTVPVTITLRLRAEPGATSDLASTAVRLPPGAGPGYYRFAFTVQPRSHGAYYYALMEARETSVLLPLAEGPDYLNGAAYENEQPLDAQAAFRLVYAPGRVALGLLEQAGKWLGLLALAGFLFVIPGWALLDGLRRRRSLSWAEVLGLGAGAGLALYPLLFLGADLLDMHPGSLLAWLPGGLGLAVLAWRRRRWRPRQGIESWRGWSKSEAFWPDIALLAGAVLVLGVRLLVVGTLDAPLWGDSYEHATMTQLFLDHRGLPDSWEPYAPYQTFSVHFGFPAAAAVLSWLAGLTSTQSTLLMAQLINGLSVLALYPLAVRMARGNRWAGVGAVVIAGLLSPMPAFYVNWGRFAQLASQAILPVALWLLWEATVSERHFLGPVALAGGAAAGMALSYYRMPFYYAVFVVAWLVGSGLPLWRRHARQWLAGVARLCLIGVIAAVLLAPQGLRLAGTQLAGGLQTGVSRQVSLLSVLAEYRIWRTIGMYVPIWLLVLAGVALLWSLARRQWQVAALGLWALGMAALSAGRLLHLPGANMLQSFAVLIALYIPASLMVGWLAGQVAEAIRARIPAWLVTVVVIAVAACGVVAQAGIVRSANVLVTRPDFRAMAWIEQNTPPESRFLVETFRNSDGTAVVGGDAGWWIPLLARRQTLLPPQYALMSESPLVPGYSRTLMELVASLQAAGPQSPEGLAILCEQGITHLFVGQRQGAAGDRAEPLFRADTLAHYASFVPVYHEDRVWVFSLDRRACGGID
jgi:hypothetical protein